MITLPQGHLWHDHRSHHDMQDNGEVVLQREGDGDIFCVKSAQAYRSIKGGP